MIRAILAEGAWTRRIPAEGCRALSKIARRHARAQRVHPAFTNLHGATARALRGVRTLHRVHRALHARTRETWRTIPGLLNRCILMRETGLSVAIHRTHSWFPLTNVVNPVCMAALGSGMFLDMGNESYCWSKKDATAGAMLLSSRSELMYLMPFMVNGGCQLGKASFRAVLQPFLRGQAIIV